MCDHPKLNICGHILEPKKICHINFTFMVEIILNFHVLKKKRQITSYFVINSNKEREI